MWIYCKQPKDVARQIEIPGKATIFVARHKCYVALEVTLYHDWKASMCCNRLIFSFNTYEVMRPAAPIFAAFVQYINFENYSDVIFMLKI